jgi:hypothetical protein
MNLLKTPIRLDLRFLALAYHHSGNPYPDGIETLPQEALEKCPADRPKFGLTFL